VTLTTDADFREVLDAHAEAWFQRYHAALVGRIETYDQARQVADISPMVLLYVEGIAPTKSPVLRDVPVAFPGGSLTSYTWPLVQGDPVELVPQDADFGAYFASGAVKQLPTSNRRFSLSDCIAIPHAPRSQASPLPSTAVAADGGVLAGLHYAGGSDATDFAAMAAKVLSELQALSAWADAHIHTTPSGPSGVPTIPTTPPGSVASTLLKVK
jgi:hypothetical protein